LQELVKNILAYRDAAPRSGLLGNLDTLSGVSGITPRPSNVFKQQTFPGPYTVRGFDLVGPKVGKELQSQAFNATLLALAGMLIYIAFRFEFVYGLAAVVAVFHDVIITVGLFSVLDKEISLTVIAALLTLVGFSMNDTIVIFDRIRENLPQMRRESFDNVVNLSINQTLSRTILTSGLTFLTALSLWLFGGQV
jgi:preprotein translocase subunit SecF